VVHRKLKVLRYTWSPVWVSSVKSNEFVRNTERGQNDWSRSYQRDRTAKRPPKFGSFNGKIYFCRNFGGPLIQIHTPVHFKLINLQTNVKSTIYFERKATSLSLLYRYIIVQSLYDILYPKRLQYVYTNTWIYLDVTGTTHKNNIYAV